MQMVPVEKVLDVTSEHPDHKAFSLVTGFGQWTTETPGEEKAELTLRLCQLVQIARIELANESSAWLDIRVSRAGTTFGALLPTICLQSRKESKEGDNARIRRVLEIEDFNETLRQDKFDLVKVICRQPFNRSVLFGLSYLKFFTYLPEDGNKKQKPKPTLSICQDEREDIVLDIVQDLKGHNANGSRVAGTAIKNASLQDINREKRFVNTPVNDDGLDPSESGGELRAKSVLKRFVNSTSSPAAFNVSKRPPISHRREGVVKPSFIFAPKVSAAAQEASAKKAAIEASEVIPGRSPRKARNSGTAVQSSITSTTTKYPGDAKWFTEANLTNEADGDIDQNFVKDTLPRWKKGKKHKTQDNQADKGISVSPTASSSNATRITQACPTSVRVRRHTISSALLDREDETNAEKKTRGKVPLSKVRSSLPDGSVRPKQEPPKRKSVAIGRQLGATSDFDSAKPPAAKRAKKASDILQRIFSSSEDESTPSSVANTQETDSFVHDLTVCGRFLDESLNRNRTSREINEDISVVTDTSPGLSWQNDLPGRTNTTGERASKDDVWTPLTVNDVTEGEPPDVTANCVGSQLAVIKPEVKSDGEDMPVIIKTEVIELGDSDNASEIKSPQRQKDQQKTKKRNRNPPVSCEVESDSDLEVIGNDLMRGVIFALSGFKNPYRSSLRSMAISMGAKYRPDWDDTCTHLVCAFKNTPKYNEVRSKGGRIVTAAWIATSHLKQKLANWKNFRLH
ncbi:hypothetical protein BIW11_07887 [Tropilaelaps mercedesae]|uniref:BRCT domain-containing protein n=1 Tax=Tropilaelaps mercedesae TaxID=418985 RepID=A0A1V9XRZ8_9ACAR|nr:hypothetical protein BIW11_07887 [Tropilaelaps mercedesae]